MYRAGASDRPDSAREAAVCTAASVSIHEPGALANLSTGMPQPLSLSAGLETGLQLGTGKLARARCGLCHTRYPPAAASEPAHWQAGKFGGLGSSSRVS